MTLSIRSPAKMPTVVDWDKGVMVGDDMKRICETELGDEARSAELLSLTDVVMNASVCLMGWYDSSRFLEIVTTKEPNRAPLWLSRWYS